MATKRRPSPSGPKIHAVTALAGNDREPQDQASEGRWTRYHSGHVIGGKYRLESMLGEGGMGAVWQARNLSLESDVAIKLVRSDLTAPEVAERLMIEARSAARLDHPAIVRVYDFGRTEHGDPFIVMEVVHGEGLADLLDRKGNLPAATAVPLLLPIASALSAAHAKGIVHRDVKPDNIILMTGNNGLVVPKLVDFGVARVDDQVPGKRRLTRVGDVVGSPDYMAPEQAMAKTDVDDRVDVWAFCVVLYETIVGRRPFDGDTYAEVMTAVLRDEPRPTTSYGAGDDALWQIIEQGLAKNRDKRWASMRALGNALAQWAVDRGIESDATGGSLTRQWLSEGTRRLLSDAPAAGGMRQAGATPDVAPRVVVIGADGTPTPVGVLAPAAHDEASSSAPTSRTRTVVVAAASALVAVAVLMGYQAVTASNATPTVPSSLPEPEGPAPSAQVVTTSEALASAPPAASASAAASPTSAPSASAPPARAPTKRPAGPKPSVTHQAPAPAPKPPSAGPTTSPGVKPPSF